MNDYRDDRPSEEEQEEWKGITLRGKDEMNLAEFPFAALRRHGDSREAFVYEGYITLSDGTRRQQRWIVRGLSGIGLPTEYDERVMVALMAVTASHGFQTRKVPFSVFQLLSIMGVQDSRRNYQSVENSLERLVGVTIFAEGSFWDNAEKDWVKLKSGFHLIERYWLRYKEEDEQIRETERSPGYIVWSEDIWKSMQDGYIKNLDLRLYYSLDSPLARRLYRFLDKRTYYRPEYEIDIFELASRLGMARYEFPSRVIDKLKPALDELAEVGYLLEAESVKVGKYTRMRFRRSAQYGAPELADSRAPCLPLPDKGDEEQSLMGLGFSEKEAAQLVATFGTQRVAQKLSYLAWEMQENGNAIRHPKGWVRRALTDDFSAPVGYHRKSATGTTTVRQQAFDALVEMDEAATEDAALWEEITEDETARNHLWAAIQRDLALTLTRATYEMVVAPSRLRYLDDVEAIVEVRNEQVRQMLSERLQRAVLSAFAQQGIAGITLTVAVADAEER